MWAKKWNENLVQNKLKNTTTNVPEKYETNVKMRWKKNSKLKIKFTLPVFYSAKFCNRIPNVYGIDEVK